MSAGSAVVVAVGLSQWLLCHGRCRRDPRLTLCFALQRPDELAVSDGYAPRPALGHSFQPQITASDRLYARNDLSFGDDGMPHIGFDDLGTIANLVGWAIFFRQGLLIQAGAEHFKEADDDDPSEVQERLMLGFSRLSQVFFYECVAAVQVLLPVALKWVS